MLQLTFIKVLFCAAPPPKPSQLQLVRVSAFNHKSER